MNHIESQLAHWNERARLGERAGTDDWVAEELERRAIERHVRDGMWILEMGCGTGSLSLRLAEKYAVRIDAFDISPRMIEVAQSRLEEKPPQRGLVTFWVGDVSTVELDYYELAITERCIINLPDWATQRKAIRRLLNYAGRYLMVENSQDGLDRINALRARVNLPPIAPPEHNRYLRDEEIEELARESNCLLRREYIASTYAFVSRVLNATLAQSAGREPDYSDLMNRLCLAMPGKLLSGLCGLGQTVLWDWTRP